MTLQSTAQPSSTISSDSTTFDGPSLVRDGEILVRGVPIRKVISEISYIDMLFFQLQARMSTDIEREMMSAYLVSLCEHGVTSPSTHAPRVAASVRAPFAISAISFIAGAMGPYHFGALEKAMQELVKIVETNETPESFVARKLESGERAWGYGHRFHKSDTEQSNHNRPPSEHTDPRVSRLIQIADELDWQGGHLNLVRRIGSLLHERKGVPINIDGLGAALLLDMGFEPHVGLLFVIIGRLPNIARLHSEELHCTPNRFTALATRQDPGFDRTIDRDQHSES